MRFGRICGLLGMAALGGVLVSGSCRVWAGMRTTAAPAHAIPAGDRVDINHASLDELLKLPGMTRSWAGRIVRFRPYRAKTDLLNRGVLPSGVYDRVKDYIVAHRKKQ